MSYYRPIAFLLASACALTACLVGLGADPLPAASMAGIVVAGLDYKQRDFPSIAGQVVDRIWAGLLAGGGVEPVDSDEFVMDAAAMYALRDCEAPRV